MINILSGPISKADILSLLRVPGDPAFLPSMEDDVWQQTLRHPETGDLFSVLYDNALEAAHEPMPQLTDAMYEEFHRSGIRHLFEAPYFDRRRQLGFCALALLSADPGDRDFLTRAFLQKLEEVFNEVSWALPAHVQDLSGKNPLTIDLFGAETAYSMAEYLTVFRGLIPDEFAALILARLKKDIFENYRDNGHAFAWTTMTNNWNGVCHQGVLGSALLVEEDLDLVAEMLSDASERLPLFLEGFTDDGGCTEGPGYWSYGFGWLCALNEILEIRSAGCLSLFEGNDKIRKIAEYAPAVSFSGGKVANFADGGNQPISTWVLSYIGKRLDIASCLLLAKENAVLLYHKNFIAKKFGRPRSDFTQWQRIFRHFPGFTQKDDAPITPDVYLPDLAVWVVRGQDEKGHLWELAAKGGYNEEHHNHNDIGSFILNLDGMPVITEIGAPLYVKAFFKRETRYEFLAARSLAHSLPLINKVEQSCGHEFTGKVLSVKIGADTVFFEIDMTAAYPASAGCRKVTRKITLAKRAGILTVEDEVEFAEAGEVEFGIITDGTVEIESNKVATISKPDVELLITLDSEANWQRVETHNYANHQNEAAFIHRLVAIPPSKSSSVRFVASLTRR